MDSTKALITLREKIAAIPQYDRGYSWEASNYMRVEEMRVYGPIASMCKFILDNSEAVLTALAEQGEAPQPIGSATCLDGRATIAALQAVAEVDRRFEYDGRRTIETAIRAYLDASGSATAGLPSDCAGLVAALEDWAFPYDHTGGPTAQHTERLLRRAAEALRVKQFTQVAANSVMFTGGVIDLSGPYVRYINCRFSDCLIKVDVNEPTPIFADCLFISCTMLLRNSADVFKNCQFHSSPLRVYKEDMVK